MNTWFPGLLACFVLGCTTNPGTGGDLGADGVACGDMRCTGGQYCVNPCCGGAPPRCEPRLDGGTCPAGSEISNCPAGGGDDGGLGCIRRCAAPPPFCAPLPAGCSGEPNCRCLNQNPCGSAGSCGILSVPERQIACVCA